MPDDEEWAFENEIDLWDDGESPPPAEAEPEPDGPTGRDGDSVVTVTVSPEGEVRKVELAEDWKSKVDPRGLHSTVLTAANAATIQALVRQTQDTQRILHRRPTRVRSRLRSPRRTFSGSAMPSWPKSMRSRLAWPPPIVRSPRRVPAGTSREPPRAGATSVWTSTRHGRPSRETPRSKPN